MKILSIAPAMRRRTVVVAAMALLLGACAANAPDLEPPEMVEPAATTQGIQRSFGAKTSQGRNSARQRQLRVVRELPLPSGKGGISRQEISPGDKLEIVFFNVEKLNRTVQVDTAGNISLPLVGTVHVAGKSPRELEAYLRQLYGARYLQDPQIIVNVKESVGQRITIHGEVKAPGVYPVVPGTTLVRALALGRGLTSIADPAKVYVYRKIDGVQYVARYDINAIHSGRRADPPIFGGDIIAVFPSSTKVAMENLKAILGLTTQVGRVATMPLP